MKKNSVFLKGDLCKILGIKEKLKIDERHINIPSLKSKFMKEFSKDELMQWRFALSNSIGLSIRPTANDDFIINNINKNTINIQRQQAQFLFHEGKYKQSSILFKKAINISKNLKMEKEEVELLLDLCSAYIAYGALWKPIRNLVIVRKKLASFNNDASFNRLYENMLLKKICIFKNWRKPFKIIKFTFLYDFLFKGKVKREMIKVSDYALQIGNWFDFQQIALLCEQMDLDLDDISTTLKYYIPPVSEGYKHLGYVTPQLTHIRNEIIRTRRIDENLIETFLNICSNTNNIPERWKLLWLVIRYDRKKRTYDNIQYAYEEYMKCEYIFWRVSIAKCVKFYFYIRKFITRGTPSPIK